MKSFAKSTAFLVLSDGMVFEGEGFGSYGTVFGEVVFNTGITGYQEVITDPSYNGQLVVFTYPEIGNTGVNPYDQESEKPHAKGIIIRQLTNLPSNWRSKQSLENWLIDEKVVGIKGIDTRTLVRHIRDFGAMNAVISTETNLSPEELFQRLKQQPSMNGLNLVDKVTTTSGYIYKHYSDSTIDFDRRQKSQGISPYKVVAIDFGIKRSILNRLVAYGCEVNVLPANSSFETVINLQPDGVFLSNGPGDPASVTSGIKLAQRLINDSRIPLFGICLGHQILGLAIGGRTFKLPYGHRGLNHPCGTSGRLEITSQNHGFAIDPNSLPKDKVEITHFNLNDKTVAGISLKHRSVFGIQYHPEASPGPHDADHHFSRFVSLMEENRRTVV